MEKGRYQEIILGGVAVWFAPRSIWTFNSFARKRGLTGKATFNQIGLELAKVITTDTEGRTDFDVLNGPEVLRDFLLSAANTYAESKNQKPYTTADALNWIDEVFTDPEKQAEVMAMISGEQTETDDSKKKELESVS